jgi:hypothetical protein
VAAAALTTLYGQATFRIVSSNDPVLVAANVFRLRYGSRSHGALPIGGLS